ncbi:hypothetical protein ACFO26_03295 [Lactococcus nasutitermitis]|uniref:DNA-binding protein n=1 Tax=Lactococcus nasutitermitis TaxID=1652957 RepID=A0ABV9JD68_9LACT|nr:hypothetical protein [Lactococcus nasutitermitis]
MENKLETLRQKMMDMEIVTIAAAVDLTGLSREAIIDFVNADSALRIFDEKNSCWINENVEGHC